MSDLRHTIRGLLKTPGFTTAVVLTLALGIGANTAIFQLINEVVLRTLPVNNPEELAEIRIVGGNRGFGMNDGRYAQLTQPAWQEVRAHQQAFAGVFAWGTRDIGIGERSDLKHANGIAVSGDFFRVLGINAWRGRLLGPADEGACPASVVVVSYGFWQREMGGRELGAAAAATLKMNFQPVDVVGVTPPGFFGVAVGESFDVAMPLCEPKEPQRHVFDIAVMGRLRPDWTIERASAHLDAMSAGIFDAVAPTGYGAGSIARFKAFRLGAYSAATGVSSLRRQYDTSLRLLLAIAGLVLLIACANLANLMLARGSARSREVAVRLALGASRSSLVRQCLAESVVLAMMGAGLAICLARLLSRAMIVALATEGGTPELSLSTDWRVLLFAALVAFATCVIVGLAPAIRATRVQPALAIRGAGRGMTTGRDRLSMQRLMVGTQIAMSLVMLVAALLFVRSFRNLMTIDAGMRQEGIAVAQLGFFDAGISPEQRPDFRRELLAEVRSVPGIVSAGTTSHTPLLGGSWEHGIRVAAKQGSAKFTWVSPGYFETMGIPIVEGRDFTLRDTQNSPRVAVVNRAFIRGLVEGRPLGQTLRTGSEPNYPSTVYEIVGVIPDTKYNDMKGDTPPMVFAPDTQHPSQGPWTAMMIYASVPADVAAASVRERLRQRYPLVISQFSVFQSRIREGFVRERLLAMLAGFFGALAALLTVVGLYGMLSYTVSQRRSELSVRMALGAQRKHIIGLVMREVAWLLVVGVVVGSVLSLIAGRSASALLFGLKPDDPATLAAACALMAVIAAAASCLPARKATKIDPAQVMREA